MFLGTPSHINRTHANHPWMLTNPTNYRRDNKATTKMLKFKYLRKPSSDKETQSVIN
jgi:hypothetical protein